jgi:hypothetical protein
MSDADIPLFFRPSYFDGQRLAADDLGAAQDFHRGLRWLHNRSMHMWGIALGFMVTGERGDRSVTVQPGYALDCLGRDLLLTSVVTLPVPPVSGSDEGQATKYYLTASYAEDADIAPSETRLGVCEGEGAVRRPEGARIRWRALGDPDPDNFYVGGYDIILASVSIKNCQLAAPVALDERRDARPSDQPYIAAGSTPEGGTVWQFWPSDDAPLGVATVVDTTVARFEARPNYLAHVIGHRLLESGTEESPPRLLDGFVEVANPSPSGFELRMLMPMDVESGATILNPTDAFTTQSTLVTLQNEKNWYVVWMGLEA